MKLKTILFVAICVYVRSTAAYDDDEDEDPYTSTDPKKREPSPCEICKFFVTEFQNRLDESSRSKEIIRTGHGLETKKKEFKYATSELRLTEALHEPHICENILEYNVHAERKGSLRYAKGMSETFQTLHGLVDKGVKVELGIPYDLWDKPSAEVTKMHRKCFNMAEYHEDDIENWYYNHQDENLFKYLCYDRYLPRVGWKDTTCLDEIWTGQEKVDFEKKAKEDEEKRKQKAEEKRLKEEARKKKKLLEEKKRKLEAKKKSMKGDTGTPGTNEKHHSPPEEGQKVEL